MSSPQASGPPRLELKGITKQFPGVLANDRVDLRVMPGEIHALLGENGAGKSTLVKQIYGVLHPDSGEILWDGKPVHIADPHAARALGIGMVFQHFSLFQAMTVLENVALGVDGVTDMAALAKRVRAVSEQYGLPLDPSRDVYSLSVGERQRIEIVRALLQDPKLLIMDEPTSVLTPQEVEKLFETLRLLAAEGRSILYISHKLDEIRVLCHAATILRGGKLVGACDPAKETARSMAALMVGTQIKPPTRSAGGTKGAPRLKVERLSAVSPESHGIDLKDVSFEVRAGEVFGIAGVAGNGQAELLAALSGELLVDRADAIMLEGKPVGRSGARDRRDLGLCYVPEERNGHGAVGDFSLSDNAFLSSYRRKQFLSGGLIRKGDVDRFASTIVERYNVKTAGIGALARSLSGGNLQKFIMGREILQEPTVMIAAQPTWGVDAGAAALIHQALLDLAARGAAVLIVSQDLDELLALTERLAVIHVGRLSQALVTADASIEQIGLLMGGLHEGHHEPVAERVHA
ncbi:MAG: ABC transporter ATP-binding protein [Geminicoccaceae bacterium]